MVGHLSLKVRVYTIEKYLHSNNEKKMNDFLQRRQRSEDHLSESTDNAGAFDFERRKDKEDFDKDSLSVLK